MARNNTEKFLEENDQYYLFDPEYFINLGYITPTESTKPSLPAIDKHECVGKYCTNTAHVLIEEQHE